MRIDFGSSNSLLWFCNPTRLVTTKVRLSRTYLSSIFFNESIEQFARITALPSFVPSIKVDFRQMPRHRRHCHRTLLSIEKLIKVIILDIFILGVPLKIYKLHVWKGNSYNFIGIARQNPGDGLGNRRFLSDA